MAKGCVTLTNSNESVEFNEVDLPIDVCFSSTSVDPVPIIEKSEIGYEITSNVIQSNDGGCNTPEGECVIGVDGVLHVGSEIKGPYVCDSEITAANHSELRGIAESHRSYVPTEFHEELPHFPVAEINVHLIGGCKSQMNASSWLKELQYENDNWLKSYIYTGITRGFAIVDQGSEVDTYDCPNYRSVSEPVAGEFVRKLID